VERNAKRTQNLSATTALENAAHAQLGRDALKVLPVILLARKYHQMKLTPATGPHNHQPANKIQRAPLTRNHVLINAKLHRSESATLRVVCVLSVNKVAILNVFKLLISVNKPTKRSISARANHSKVYTE